MITKSNKFGKIKWLKRAPFGSKCSKIRYRLGLHPRPRLGAYDTQYNTIQYNCNLIMPSLQSSEVHIEAGQLLRAINRLKEVSFKFRAKDSLAKRVANMRR